MSWFNYYGLLFMTIIMLPNIIYAIKNKSKENKYQNKIIETLEQIGRYGCFIFMVFNIPYLYYNFWFNHGLIFYLSINFILCIAYLLFWIICWNKYNKLKALSLSIIPSCIFLYSGIVLANFPLIIFSILFAICHILISYKSSL